MTKICTDIDQSKKLIELGIDLNTADMYWSVDEIPYYCYPVGDIVTDWEYAQENGMLPAWSLSNLLELMPNGSKICKSDLGSYFCHGVLEDTPLDAAFDMVVWLLENKKI
jgi:hypothetical protein